MPYIKNSSSMVNVIKAFRKCCNFTHIRGIVTDNRNFEPHGTLEKRVIFLLVGTTPTLQSQYLNHLIWNSE